MNCSLRTFSFLTGFGLLSLYAIHADGSRLGLQTQLNCGLTPEQAEILSHLSIAYLDDENGGLVKTIVVTGTNVQILSGAGSTNAAPNGAGNLILGYAEPVAGVGTRTGSHNLILGRYNEWESYGGIVAGEFNRVSGPVSSILGGSSNTADGGGSTVVGGQNNDASGNYSVAVGGNGNEAKGGGIAVGGSNNLAMGTGSVVVAGQSNTAEGGHSVVVSGLFNRATNTDGAVVGGWRNEAIGLGTVTVGGFQNASVGLYSVITGGSRNFATGSTSVVSAGNGREALGPWDWIAGNLFEDI